jgi:hypothetical protein
MDVDIAVLGGPGGYTAAIRAAQLGDPRPAARQRHDQAADGTQWQAAPRLIGFDISKRVMLLS